MVYSEELVPEIHALALLGMSNREIAAELGMPHDEFEVWVEFIPPVESAIRRGRNVADGKVARSLYERAIGYSHPEEKIMQHNGEVLRVETIRHYPPDVKAAEIWLSRRRPQDWTQHSIQEHTGKIQFETAMQQLYGGEAPQMIEGKAREIER